MNTATASLSEQQRLDALWRASLLDTEREPFFEDLIDTVQTAIGAPIALVTLVDEHRQWFKARRGLDTAETPRDVSFCARAIEFDRPLIVTDATTDARFKDNPAVLSEPYVRSYAGAPIILDTGARLGTVCVADHVTRAWSPRDITHLTRNARIAARHIEARQAQLERDRPRFLEQALQRIEERYNSVLLAMSEGFVLHGPSGAIVDSNPAAGRILGLTEEEMYGRVSRDPRWRSIRPSGEDFPGDEHPAMITLRTGEPQRDVVMGLETPRGERRWIRINTQPIRNLSSGRVDYVAAVFQQFE